MSELRDLLDKALKDLGSECWDATPQRDPEDDEVMIMTVSVIADWLDKQSHQYWEIANSDRNSDYLRVRVARAVRTSDIAADVREAIQ